MNIMPFYRAIGYAESAHAGQLDKGRDPYICHCLRVGASLLPDLQAAVVGVLHDVMEDTTGWDRDALRELVGSDAAMAALDLLTRHPQMSYPMYITRIGTPRLAAAPREAHLLACRVKLADLRDNLDPARLLRAREFGHDMSAAIERYEAACRFLEIRILVPEVLYR